MLIPSRRHTTADLELWSELEAADRLHARTIDAKVWRSLDTIRMFAGVADCYASVSWGKDSVALASLIATSGTHVPLVHLRAVPHANPENDAVRDAFLSRFPLDYHENVVDYRDIPPGLGPDATEREKDRRFYAAFPGKRYLSGIRADESHGRKIRMRNWGLISKNCCAPLGWWTAADVFAYLARHDLPVHPSYAMLGGGRWRRDQIRVDELGGERGNQFGRTDWEREYYGDTIRRLAVTRPPGTPGTPRV